MDRVGIGIQSTCPRIEVKTQISEITTLLKQSEQSTKTPEVDVTGFSLKDQLFNRQKVEYLAKLFADRDSAFAQRRFVASVMQELPSLELKQRITLIAETLEKHLPRYNDHRQAVGVADPY